MAATRSAVRERAKGDRGLSPSPGRPTPPVRTLRSGGISALIDGDGPPLTGHTAPRGSRAKRRPTSVDPLDGAPVVVSIRHTKPGSPLDEHLRREQTQALLDLLADHMVRQREAHSKAARR